MLNKIVSKQLVLFIAAIILAICAYFVLPDSVPELAKRTAALFVLAAVLWATEAIPLFATSLCLVGSQILLLAQEGGLSSSGNLNYKEFLAPFSSGVIILFMGGFLLSKAITKHGLDEIIGKKLLHPFAKSPIMLLYGVLSVTAFFSMWMSNTASATMMLAITLPILKHIPRGDEFHRAIILAVPFGANIGGLGTPIGTPPNAVCLANLRNIGIDIGFVKWMFAAVPMVIILIAITGYILYRIFPYQEGFVPHMPEVKVEPLTVKGRWVCAILGLTVFLWLTSKWHGINEAVVALIAAALLTALGILDKRDVDSIDWNILLLMWGGLSLSNAMKLTALDQWIGGVLSGVSFGVWLSILFVLVSVILSTVMSNTATANLLIPIALVASANNQLALAILTSFACSFAMALPISTPPNAIAFGTGNITTRQMFIAGASVSAVAISLLLLGYNYMLPLVFG